MVKNELLRAEGGKFAKGNKNKAGPGRPKNPQWFKDRGPDAMRYLLKVAMGEEKASESIRMHAVSLVVERIYGKPPTRKAQAPLDGDGQRTFTKTEVAVFLLQAYEAGEYALGLDVNAIIEGDK